MVHREKLVVKVLGRRHHNLLLNHILLLLLLLLHRLRLLLVVLVGAIKQKLVKESLQDGPQEKLEDKKDALQEELLVMLLGAIKRLKFTMMK